MAVLRRIDSISSPGRLVWLRIPYFLVKDKESANENKRMKTHFLVPSFNKILIIIVLVHYIKYSFMLNVIFSNDGFKIG